MRPFTAEELKRRTPVWVEMSELFLDTPYTEASARHAAEVLRASGYDLPTLERILHQEVAPVFWSNMASVAGEWAGWADADVQDLILSHLRRPWPLRLPALLMGRAAVSSIAPDWRRVRQRLAGD